MYTDALNKRCFSWSSDVLQLRPEGMLIVLVTRRIWKMLQIRDVFWSNDVLQLRLEGMSIALVMRGIWSKDRKLW